MQYTDQKLLDLLHLYYSDYGRVPTQREILADPRLPTHHTYRSRFGTIANAIERAGLSDIAPLYDNLHKVVAGWLTERGFTYFEYVKSDSDEYVIFDFVVITNAGTVVIDIFDTIKTRTSVVAQRHNLVDLSGHKVLTINNLEDIDKLSQL